MTQRRRKGEQQLEQKLTAANATQSISYGSRNVPTQCSYSLSYIAELYADSYVLQLYHATYCSELNCDSLQVIF